MPALKSALNAVVQPFQKCFGIEKPPSGSHDPQPGQLIGSQQPSAQHDMQTVAKRGGDRFRLMLEKAGKAMLTTVQHAASRTVNIANEPIDDILARQNKKSAKPN